MKTLWYPTRSQKLSRKGAAALPSLWRRFAWQELHHLSRHQLEMAKIGPTRQLGMTKRCHTEEEEVVGEYPLSGVYSLEKEAGNLSPGKSKKQQK